MFFRGGPLPGARGSVRNPERQLRDRATGVVLFSRPGIEFRDRYEVSVDPAAYFEESDAAMDRLSRDAARAVVAAILEKF